MPRRSHLTCDAPGCRRRRERWQRLCEACFRLLPADRRRAIAAATAEGRVLDRAALTRDAVAWLAANSPAARAERMLGEATVRAEQGRQFQS